MSATAYLIRSNIVYLLGFLSATCKRVQQQTAMLPEGKLGAQKISKSVSDFTQKSIIQILLPNLEQLQWSTIFAKSF